ncbi:Gamma-1-syntrophin [Nymphon striatum]|nr:Gamma-1-syntrophin [Nymphon striatum]
MCRNITGNRLKKTKRVVYCEEFLVDLLTSMERRFVEVTEIGCVSGEARPFGHISEPAVDSIYCLDNCCDNVAEFKELEFGCHLDEVMQTECLKFSKYTEQESTDVSGIESFPDFCLKLFKFVEDPQNQMHLKFIVLTECHQGIIQCEDGIVLTDWVKHIFKWNKELESHNHILPDWSHCSHTFKVHQAMFRTLKATEHVDDRHNCFLLQTGLTSSMYFSAKTRADLMRIESAWHKATYASITRLGSKTFPVIVKSKSAGLTLDWTMGFGLYDTLEKVGL